MGPCKAQGWNLGRGLEQGTRDEVSDLVGHDARAHVHMAQSLEPSSDSKKKISPPLAVFPVRKGLLIANRSCYRVKRNEADIVTGHELW